MVDQGPQVAASLWTKLQDRPTPLRIPQQHSHDGQDTPTTGTPCLKSPVHRALFGAFQQPSPQPQQVAEPEREQLEQWLDVMESCTSRRRSSSSGTFCGQHSLEPQTGSSMAAACCAESHAAAPQSQSPMLQQQQHLEQQQEEQGGARCMAGSGAFRADLPPPAFVVLGLLSGH